jgi:hypothetical protein
MVRNNLTIAQKIADHPKFLNQRFLDDFLLELFVDTRSLDRVEFLFKVGGSYLSDFKFDPKDTGDFLVYRKVTDLFGSSSSGIGMYSPHYLEYFTGCSTTLTEYGREFLIQSIFMTLLDTRNSPYFIIGRREAFIRFVKEIPASSQKSYLDREWENGNGRIYFSKSRAVKELEKIELVVSCEEEAHVKKFVQDLKKKFILETVAPQFEESLDVLTLAHV